MENRPQSTGQRALVIVMGRTEGRGQKPGWDAVERGQERAEARAPESLRGTDSVLVSCCMAGICF